MQIFHTGFWKLPPVTVSNITPKQLHRQRDAATARAATDTAEEWH